MKRSMLVFGILVAGSTFFTSCNKNLKDDVKSLKNQVEELQKHNSELQEKMNGVEDAIGSNEPIKVSTTFTDDDNKQRTVTGTYRFKTSGASTHYMRKNDDGTYEIYIERIGDIDWNEGAWIGFDYNPSTKAITDLRAGHYWDGMDAYYHNVRYSEGYGTGLTNNLTINSIDVTTGDISIKYQGAGTADYTSQVPYYYCPNPGAPVSTSFEFAGKLRVYNNPIN